MKKKLDDLTKCKLVYSGELLIFVVIMLVLGFLFVFGVIPVRDWKKWLFSIVTLLGGIWMIIDFVWTLKSEKKRKRNCLTDKVLLIPSGMTLIGLDIFALINLIKDPSWCLIGNVNFFQIEISCALFYLSAVYLFQAIYHWFNIHPMIYEMLEEEKQKEAEESASKENIEAEVKEENKGE